MLRVVGTTFVMFNKEFPNQGSDSATQKIHMLINCQTSRKFKPCDNVFKDEPGHGLKD